MKVLPVGALRSDYRQIDHASNNNNKKIYNNNYTDLNLLNKSYNQISFGAISKSAIEGIKKIPLEEKIASIIEKFIQGDLILVGKKIHKAKERMLANVDSLDDAVKRVFYIHDDKIPGYLAFSKTKDGFNQVINLNDCELVLLRGEADKSYDIIPGSGF